MSTGSTGYLLAAGVVALHGVDPVAGVQLVVRRLGRRYVRHVRHAVLTEGVVKQLELVEMRVAVKLGGYRVFVSVVSRTVFKQGTYPGTEKLQLSKN